MRTKTLLLAGAALAFSLATSQAQVYSQNVVGYVNINLTNGILECVSPALDLDGTGTNNTIVSVVGTNVPVGTLVYVFNNTGGFDTLEYSKAGRAPNILTNWENTANSAVVNNYPLNPGEGFFIVAPANVTLTQVGQVLQGALANPYVPSAAGAIWLVSSQVPLAGGVTSTLNYQPQVGDLVYLYDPIALDYNVYGYAKAGRAPNITTNWENTANSQVSEPQISVGQGFWLSPKNAGTVWTNDFIVQ